MKLINKYLLIGVTACTVLLSSCNNDEGTAPSVDLSTMNFTATPGAGEITISWTVPENPDYLFLQMEWYDPREKDTKKENFSVYTKEYVVGNTRARYGAAYNFKITPYSEDGTAGTPIELTGITSGAAEKITTFSEQELTITDYKAKDSYNGKTADYLFDGITDVTTNLYHTGTGTGTHYVDIDLTKEVSRFEIKAYNSNNHDGYAKGNPKSVSIFRISELGDTSVNVSDASASNEDWICTESFANEGKGAINDFIYPSEDDDELATPVRYIRFYAVSDVAYWNMAELEIFEVKSNISDPEVDEVAEYDQ